MSFQISKPKVHPTEKKQSRENDWHMDTPNRHYFFLGPFTNFHTNHTSNDYNYLHEILLCRTRDAERWLCAHSIYVYKQCQLIVSVWDADVKTISVVGFHFKDNPFIVVNFFFFRHFFLSRCVELSLLCLLQLFRS